MKQLENHFFSSLTEGKNYFHLTCSDFTGQTVIASAAEPPGQPVPRELDLAEDAGGTSAECSGSIALQRMQKPVATC